MQTANQQFPVLSNFFDTDVSMPLREAMAHLGHGRRAIHETYPEKAEVVRRESPADYWDSLFKGVIVP